MPLRINFKHIPDTNDLRVSFVQAVHNRGTDFKVYKNNYDRDGGLAYDPRDTDYLRLILQALMANDAGVVYVGVTNYTLTINVSPAADIDEVKARIIGACKRAQKVPVEV